MQEAAESSNNTPKSASIRDRDLEMKGRRVGGEEDIHSVSLNSIFYPQCNVKQKSNLPSSTISVPIQMGLFSRLVSLTPPIESTLTQFAVFFPSFLPSYLSQLFDSIDANQLFLYTCSSFFFFKN